MDDSSEYWARVYSRLREGREQVSVVSQVSFDLCRLRRVDIDGGFIGRTWDEKFYRSSGAAIAAVREMVDKKNGAELARTEPHILRERVQAEKDGKAWWRLYVESEIGGVHGWCNWCYGVMITWDKLTLEPLDE